MVSGIGLGLFLSDKRSRDSIMNTEREHRLDEIVTAYLKAKETGVPPNREELIALHPELAPDLAAYFSAESQIGRVAAQFRHADADSDSETVGLTGTAGPGSRVEYFGDYHLLEEIGRGGMGVVYKARQESLNRTVALKMILTGQLANEGDIKRFRAEAEAAAKLDHPGIVPVFEVGQYEGHQYFSMAFVEGESLAHKLAQGLPSPREAAELTRKVAEAVAYAHVEGVVHRDLKPANILIDKNGQPRLTDFGLAKRVEGDSNLTQTGQILGTPSYMPPEQASGKGDAVGPLSDVYSLGAILYCLLTGRPPFQAATALDTLLQVLEKEPVSPRQLNSTVPRDLETICLKCLEKEPRKRYSSARELGADLDRYLIGQPILARPASRSERAVKWMRRKPAAASLVGVSAVAALCLVVLGIVTIGEANRRARAEGDRYNEAIMREEAERDRANALDTQVAVARNHVYSSDGFLAGLALEKYSVIEMTNYLEGAKPKPGEADLRGFEWYYLWNKINAERLNLPKFGAKKPPDFSQDYNEMRLGDRRLLAFSPDGKYLATAKDLSDAVTGKVLIEYDEVPDCPVFFSADSKVLFASWKLFDLTKPLAASPKERGEEGFRIPRAPKDQFVPLGFYGKNNAFALMAAWEIVRKWDNAKNMHVDQPPMPHSVRSYEVTGKVTVHDFPVGAGLRIFAAGLVTPRGLLPVAIGDPKLAHQSVGKEPFEVWDLVSGERKSFHIEVPKEPDSVYGGYRIRELVVSPDGDTIAVVPRDRSVRLFDLTTGKQRTGISDKAHFIRFVTFSADSKTLLVMFDLGGPLHFTLWDVATGKAISEWKWSHGYYGGWHNGVARLSPDGKTVATANGVEPGLPNAGGIALWEAATGKLRTILLGHRNVVNDLSYSADGKSIASFDFNIDYSKHPAVETNTVKVWDVGDSPLSPIGHGAGREGPPIGLPVDTTPVAMIAVSPDGKTLAVGYGNGTIRTYDANALKSQKTLVGQNKARVNALKFTADGKQLLVGHQGDEKADNTFIWDLDTPKVVHSFPGYVRHVELAEGFYDQERSFWVGDFNDKLLVTASKIPASRFDGTGRRTLTLWDVAAKKSLFNKDEDDVALVALSRDGRRLAIETFTEGRQSRSIALRDVATGKERKLPGDFFGVGSSVHFSPDGKYLALASHWQDVTPEGVTKPDGSRDTGPGVRLYDVAGGKEIAFLKGPWHADFSPDGKMLLTRNDEQITLWDPTTAKELGKFDNPDRLWSNRAIFSPDGKTLAVLTIGRFLREPWRNGKRVTDGTETRIERTERSSVGHSGSSPGGLGEMHPVYELHIWDVATRERRKRFLVAWHGHLEEIVFSGDGQTVYTMTRYQSGTFGVAPFSQVQAWDVNSGQMRGTVGDHGTRYHALAYSAEGRLLAVTEQRTTLRTGPMYPAQHRMQIWDVDRRADVGESRVFTATELPVKLDAKSLTLASNKPVEPDEWTHEFSFGYRRLVELSPDGKIEAREVGGEIVLTMLPGPQALVLKGNQGVSRMDFSPDGKTLAIGTTTGQIRLWNVAAGRLVLTIQAHPGPVSGLAFRPDGRLLASCSDSELRYWRAATNEEMSRP
jgi:WD40 repeat protein/tRNA A-37 threonylcarbamoyl transferase component Bud32